VAKEFVCNDYILTFQRVYESGIAGIPDLPIDALFEPRLDPHAAILAVKHRSHFFVGHPLKDKRTDEFVGLKRIDSILSNFHNLV